MTAAAPPRWLGPAAALGTLVLRALAVTWRIERFDAPEFEAARLAGERFVYCFWHARILPLAWLHRGEGAAVLVSSHRDGEIIARVIESLGYVTGRGSSTRGGDTGLREMLAWAERGRHLAVTPDGPRGPAEHVKEGLVYLAVRSGLRIVPIGCAVRRGWTLRSWDRFRVPAPFTRIAVRHGAPVAPPDDAEPASIARVRDAVQAALSSLAAEARARVGERA